MGVVVTLAATSWTPSGKRLGERADATTRGTIHHLCAGILREHAGAAGIERHFGIADEEYQRILLRRLRVSRDRIYALLALFGRRRREERADEDEWG